MKEKGSFRLLSVLLAFAILLGLLPAGTMTAHAWESGEWAKCELCDTWDYTDTICEDCGMHYDGNDCGASLPNHCPECDKCIYDYSEICEECGICWECALETDNHCIYEIFATDCVVHVDGFCPDCGRCDNCINGDEAHCPICGECGGDDDGIWCETHGKEEGHCQECAEWCPECETCFWGMDFISDWGMCFMCAADQGYVCWEDGCRNDADCEECGLCSDHIEDWGIHCPLCENCLASGSVEWCKTGEHCVECCEICEGCDTCVVESEVSLCEYCGLCEECCAQEACPDCGMCVENDEYEEHFCPECEQCGGGSEMCEYCGMCEDCCAENGCPDCGLCAEDPDYDEHLCDCGNCKNAVDYCDICELCLDCCADNSSCSDGLCALSDEYEDHFCETCGSCFHDVDRCAECEDVLNNFCVDCCREHGEEAEEHEHDYGSNNTCGICGIKRAVSDEAPVIIRQPSDAKVRVTDVNEVLFEDDDAENTHTFHVRVLDPVGVSYQWQTRYYYKNGRDTDWVSQKGATDDDFEYFIVEDMCNYTCMEVRCVITAANGKTTTSRAARLTATHLFGQWQVNELDPTKHAYYCVGVECSSDALSGRAGVYQTGTMESHSYMAWVVTKEATEEATGQRYHDCKVCGYRETQVIAKLHEHDWSDIFDQWDDYHAKGCCGQDCMELKDIAPHVWGEEITVLTEPTEFDFGRGERTCTVCGYTGNVKIDKLPHDHDYEKNPEIITECKYSHDGGSTYSSRGHWIGCVSCGAKYSEVEPHSYTAWYDYGNYEGARGKVVLKCTECGYRKTARFTEEEAGDMESGYVGVVVAPGCIITVTQNYFSTTVVKTGRGYVTAVLDEDTTVSIEPILKEGQAVSGWTYRNLFDEVEYGNRDSDLEYIQEPDMTAPELEFSVAVADREGSICAVGVFEPILSAPTDTIPVNRVAEPAAGETPAFANSVPKKVTIVSQRWEEVGSSRALGQDGAVTPGQPVIDTFEAGRQYRYTITLASENLLYPIDKDTTVLLNSNYPNIKKELTDVTLNADGTLTASGYYSVKAENMAGIGTMYIADIFTIDSSTVLTGTVLTGSFSAGETIYLYGSDGQLHSMTIEKMESNRRKYSSAEKGDTIGIYVSGSANPASLFNRGDGISTSAGLTFTDSVTGTLRNSGRPTPMADSYRPQVTPETVTSDYSVMISGLGSSKLAKGQAAQNVSLSVIRKMMVFSGLELTLREGGRTVGSFTVTERAIEQEQNPKMVVFGTVVEGDASGTDSVGNAWTYKASTHTLTLDAISEIPCGSQATPKGTDAAIYCDGDLIIDTGSGGYSSLEYSGTANIYSADAMSYYGIFVTGNLTIQGDSPLCLSLSTDGTGSKATGVYAGGSITWKSWGGNSVQVSGMKAANSTVGLASGSGEIIVQSPELYVSAWEKDMPAQAMADNTELACPGGCVTTVLVETSYNPEDGFGSASITSAEKARERGYFTAKQPVTVSRRGDLNGDCIGNLRDVVLMFRVSMGQLQLTARVNMYADVTGDGNINLKDVSALYRSCLTA